MLKIALAVLTAFNIQTATLVQTQDHVATFETRDGNFWEVQVDNDNMEVRDYGLIFWKDMVIQIV